MFTCNNKQFFTGCESVKKSSLKWFIISCVFCYLILDGLMKPLYQLTLININFIQLSTIFNMFWFDIMENKLLHIMYVNENINFISNDPFFSKVQNIMSGSSEFQDLIIYNFINNKLFCSLFIFFSLNARINNDKNIFEFRDNLVNVPHLAHVP